ncbi:MAG: hypothetical protein AAGI17_04280 [Planctomycetota bacterium]
MDSERKRGDLLAVWVVAGVLGLSLVIVGVGYVGSGFSIETHAEGGVIETLQIVVWSLAFLVGAFAIPRSEVPRARLLARWLAFLAALAIVRELDLHEMANPDVLGDWGVHYRIDWWLSAEAPVLPRVAWAAVFIGIALLQLWLFARTGPNPVRALREGDLSAWLLVGSIGLLGAGSVADDLLRGMLPREPLQAFEEIAELVGVTLFLGSVVARLRPSGVLPRLGIGRVPASA